MACICFSPFSFLKINNTAGTIASVAEACSCAHSRRITSFVYPCPIIDRMMFITSWSLFHCSLESPHLSRHGNYLLGFFSCCKMLCISLPFHHILLPIFPVLFTVPPLFLSESGHSSGIQRNGTVFQWIPQDCRLKLK